VRLFDSKYGRQTVALVLSRSDAVGVVVDRSIVSEIACIYQF